MIKKLLIANLRKMQEENNKILEQKRLQLNSNQDKLQEETQRLSRRRSRVTGCFEQLEKLEKNLLVARKDRNSRADDYKKAQEEFYPYSRRLKKIRDAYQEAQDFVDEVKREKESVEIKLSQSKKDHIKTSSEIDELNKENSAINKAIKQGETNASEFYLSILDMEIVHAYLEKQGLQRSSSIGVSSSGMYGESLRLSQKIKAGARRLCLQ